MNNVAIVFWSGTGNTEMMAQAIAEGVQNAGGTAVLLGPETFSAAELANYGAVAFGCPAMGAEVLEEDAFEPMFAGLESSLSGKHIALFGSFGWGDGQWMRDWADRTAKTGANLYDEGLIVNGFPEGEAKVQCTAFGEGFGAY